MVRVSFGIPDYMGGPLPYGLDALSVRLSLAFAGAHVRAVERKAKAESPARTGGLRGSIRAYLAGPASGVLEASVPHAVFLHEGTGVYGPWRRPVLILPRARKALIWPGAAHPARAVRQEGIRPRDFLRAAAAMHFPALMAFALSLRMEVLEIFRRNYLKLREANAYRLQQEQEQQTDLPSGTLDKYFHCKANCEASRLGYVAEAFLASLAREGYDQIIDNSWRIFAGEDLHTIDDSIEDMAANLKGIGKGAVAPYTPCSASCAEYRPHWLPEEMW